MRLLVGIVIALVVTSTYSQSVKKYTEIGDKYMESGDYYGASLEYAKAVAIDSVDIHLLYKYAEALRQYNNHTKK